MHTRELIDFAGLLATRGELLLGGEQHLQADGGALYWSAAQCRAARWSREMKGHSLRVCSSASEQAANLWISIRPTLEEILASEVLGRVFAAVCCLHEARYERHELSPLVRVVLSGQMETRLRALNLLVYGHGLRIEDAVRLNRLRKQTERWVDLLLSLLGRPDEVVEFCFRRDRLDEFAAQWRAGPAGRTQRCLVLASLRMAYQTRLSPNSPNADLNRKIAAGVMGCLNPRLFDSAGLLKSAWLAAISQTTNDGPVLLDDWFAPQAARPETGRRFEFPDRTNRLDFS